MISILTPDGSKNLILRGILTEAGAAAIAAGSVTAEGSVDREFWDGSLASLSVSITPGYAIGVGASSIAILLYTNAVTGAASGGSPPYTYAWTIDSDDGGSPDWVIVSPSSASTNFSVSSVPPLVARDAVMKVTATDARGATGEATVTAWIENYGSV